VLKSLTAQKDAIHLTIMNEEKIGILIKYWLEGSEEDFDTMKILFLNKKYVYALFFLHLTFEKLLKALFVKTFKTQAPITHNLINLLEKLDPEILLLHEKFLSTLMPYCIEARYPESKVLLYKNTTRDLVTSLLNQSEELKAWITTKLL